VLYQKAPGEAQAYDPRDGRGLTLGNVPPKRMALPLVVRRKLHCVFGQLVPGK